MKKYILLTIGLCLFISYVEAQTRQIRGRVTSGEDGSPLPGTTVLQVGANNGTTTNVDGNYTLNITNRGGQLTFQFIGYNSKSVNITSANVYDVVLEPARIDLDEVVVTAGGIVRTKRGQGYSATKITDTELTAGKSPSIAGGLTAKIPGLQINAISSGVNPNYRLVLRGNRSITGNNQALIVVDEAIVSNELLNNINPEDIESIQVLNGASGATLYGSEASNGVLLITTKKGVKGKPKIKFSHTTTLEQVNFFPKLQSRFGQGSTADGQVFDPIENQQYGPTFDGSIRDLGYPLENGEQQTVKYEALSARKEFWETGVQNQSDISFNFGSENSTSYVAAQYFSATGTTPGDKYNKVSLRLNNTQKLLPGLNLTYNASYVENNYDTTTATGTLYDQLLNIPANVPVTSYKDWQTDKWSNPEGWFNPWYRNPYWTAANYRNDTKNTYLIGKAELKWNITSWLYVLSRSSLSNRYYQSKQHTQKLTLSDYALKEQGKTNITGFVYDRQFNTYRFNQDFNAGVSKKVEDFSLDLTVGFSYVNKSEQSTRVEATGLVIPGLFNIDNRSGNASPDAYIRHSRNYGVWGDFVTGYKNYLFLHLTGRNDYTSLLIEENRSYFYPSADVSFIVTDAIGALKENSVLDYLKIRAAVSETGNVNIDPYSLYPTYGSTTGYSNGTYFRESSSLVSHDLKPEITKGYEVGTEFKLFKNWVDVQFTYYYTSTTGQAISASIAPSSGYTGYLLNTGEVTNKGIETALRLNPIRTRDWDLRFGINYTHNKNFLKSLHPQTKRIGVNGSGVIFAEEGYEVNQIVVPDYARDEQGRVIVDINTGYPSRATESTRIGNTTPKHRLGVDLSLRWKDFTVSSVFEYRGGYYFASIEQGSTMDFIGSSARSAYYNRERFVFPNSSYWDESKGAYVENTNITVSDGGSGFWTNSTYNRGTNSNYVYSGDYWKWRELAVSYQVPRVALHKITDFVQEITISLQGRNLLLWTPKSNEYTDPDYSANDNNAIGVATLSQTPPTRYIGGSISFTF